MGPSIKDVHRDGVGQMRTGGGVKALADVRKLVLFFNYSSMFYKQSL